MQEVDGVYEMIPDQFNNVYDDMRRKLTAKGIPEEEIAFIKANHDGQQYEMQDRIIHFFPAQIKLTQERISGLNEDKKTLLSHPVSGNDFSMEILGTNYAERKDAGNALIEIAQRNNNPEGKLNCIFGSYRGFSLSLTLQNGMFYIAMKGKLSYTAELGTDAVGNIARMNHVLECIPNQLESAVENLSTLNTQLENTKTESELTFPQGQELAEKSARLNQLNLELNKDNKSGEQKENSNKERTQLRGTPIHLAKGLTR